MNSNILFNTLVDSLDLRLCTLSTPSSWLYSQSQLWRDYHKSAIGDYSIADMLIEIPGFGYWSLKPFGHRPYEFVLVNPEICDIRVWALDKWSTAVHTQTGQLYLSFRSKFLQYNSLVVVEDFVNRLSAVFFDTPKLIFNRVSRADLACDVACQGFAWSDLDRFITRSRYKEAFTEESQSIQNEALDVLRYNGQPPQGITRGVVHTGGQLPDSSGIFLSQEQLDLIIRALESKNDEVDVSRVIYHKLPQTLYFGRFSSPIYARIYNKLASLAVQDKEYMKDIWRDRGWDGEESVWRFEFSLSGDFLKNAIDFSIVSEETGEIITDLRNFDSFLAAIPQIWQYCTHKWLRYTMPSEKDSNFWRSTLAPLWQVVQTAWDSDLVIIRKKLETQYDESQMVAQIKGVALTISARRSLADAPTEEAFSIILNDLWEYFDSSQFHHDLRERRQLLGIDDLSSDTSYSMSIRSSRMRQGFGS